MGRISLVVSVAAVALFGVLALVDPAPPAAQDAAPAASPPTGAPEVLVGVLLPAERLPDSDRVAGAYTVRLRPGGRVDFPAGSQPDGAALEHVVAGAYAVRSEGRRVVLRGGATAQGSAEEVPPGTEATVGHGESLLILENDAPAMMRNPGDEETLVFGAGVFSREPPLRPATPTAGVAAVDASIQVAGVQELQRDGIPVSVHLERWVLGPGQALPPLGRWPELAWAEAPFATTSRSNPGAEPIEVLPASFGSAD